jgi:HEAT repeat protein
MLPAIFDRWAGGTRCGASLKLTGIGGIMVVLCRPLLEVIVFGLLFSWAAFLSPIPLSREFNFQQRTDRERTANPQASAPKDASETPRTLKQQAWEILETGAKTDKTRDRAAAIHILGLLPNDRHARKMAEAALSDRAPEVRSAAAAALGDMHSRHSIAKLKAATDDKDPSVALAAAHALILLKDDAGYDVYYEVLAGERKTGKGLLAEAAGLRDPKKLAEIGFQEGIGFIPFAGLGWKAFKTIKKGDSAPARAAAATILADDPDPRTTEALANATGDKNWIIRAAALEALAKRADPSVLGTVELYLSDQEGEVKYTAAATALRLIAIRQAQTVNKEKGPKQR